MSPIQMPAPISTNGSNVKIPVAMKNTSGTIMAMVAMTRPAGPNVVSLLAKRDGLGVGPVGFRAAGGTMAARFGTTGGVTAGATAGASWREPFAKKSYPSSADAVMRGRSAARRGDLTVCAEPWAHSLVTAESDFSRPTSVDELVARLDNFVSPDGEELLNGYRPDPDDVFVVTPAKCGTTWMQQIVHGLRSGGSMDFDNINDVVPWLGLSHTAEEEARAAQQDLRPHVFKSHSPLDQAPQGARYIVVLRDPADAMLSHYRFAAGVFFDADSIDFDTFAREFYLPRRAVHEHVIAMWPGAATRTSACSATRR